MAKITDEEQSQLFRHLQEAIETQRRVLVANLEQKEHEMLNTATGTWDVTAPTAKREKIIPLTPMGLAVPILAINVKEGKEEIDISFLPTYAEFVAQMWAQETANEKKQAMAVNEN